MQVNPKGQQAATRTDCRRRGGSDQNEPLMAGNRSVPRDGEY